MSIVLKTCCNHFEVDISFIPHGLLFRLYSRRHSKSVDVATGHGWKSRGRNHLQRRHTPSVIPVQGE